jgi:hypothetical protein
MIRARDRFPIKASLARGAIAAVAVLLPALAHADQRMWASVLFGPAAGIEPARFETEVFGLGVEDEYDGPTQVKLVQAFGFQLLEAQRGPAIGLELQESLGDRHLLLQIVPRLAWSFPLQVKRLRLQLTPSIGLGFIHFTRRANGGLGGNGNGLTLQLAVEGRLSLSRRWFLLLRPIGIDIQSMELISGQVADWGTFVRYDLLIGCGLRL